MIIPYPPSYPFIGHLLDYIKNIHNYDDWYLELHKRYGSVVNTWIPFSFNSISISDPENVEYILKTNFQNYVKGPQMYQTMYEFLGDGIFNVDGDLWKSQRKNASHMFTTSTMRNFMFPIFVEKSKKMIQKMKKEQYIDINSYLHEMTLDSIYQIIFGVSNNTNTLFSEYFDECQEIIANRFIYPFWRLPFSSYLLFSERKYKKNMMYINDNIQKLITEIKQSDIDNSILSIFIKNGITDDKYLRDIALNFMLAGRDTTAQALIWLLYLVSEHKDVEMKIKEEIKNVINGELTYDKLSHMTYLHCVILETLRLYPSVPKDIKLCVNDDVLPNGKYTIRGGSMVVYLPYTMGRNENIWKDAHLFKPERFMNYNPSAYKYPVFQAGPRICLGKQMALIEIKTIAILIYQHLDLCLVSGSTDTVFSVTMKMKNKLIMRDNSK
jgi:cytochrome P450